eukprot:TRINITY_DN8782_c0_g4_i2.p1 TRINITY_DN8782_c0_g4~~TRINITY_DN8782_c0_g4_i2.p1  ORF type:complete len:256 (+),score=66.63 TRINITY_DN8782_c0_g4_i2:123-890(+)
MAAEVEKGMAATIPSSPKWSIYSKPEMVIGGPVPSWVKSVPGPKYNYDTNCYKDKRPQWSMREKPKMIIGSAVPSWQKSIPGPKYNYDTNCYKKKAPQWSMLARNDEPKGKSKLLKDNAAPPPPELLKQGLDATRPKAKSFSVTSKPAMIPGDPVPSWVKSIPGPKYKYPVEVYKDKRPNWSIGKKLPSEGDLMSVRSPGPANYSGPAVCAKKQGEVDGSKKRSFSCSFGIGARWEGPTAAMARSGALARYNAPA